MPSFLTRAADVQYGSQSADHRPLGREAACSTPAGGAQPHTRMGGKKSKRLLRMTQRDPPKAQDSQKSRNVLRDLSLQGRHLWPQRNQELPPRRVDTIGLTEAQVQRLLAATHARSQQQHSGTRAHVRYVPKCRFYAASPKIGAEPRRVPWPETCPSMQQLQMLHYHIAERCARSDVPGEACREWSRQGRTVPEVPRQL